MDNYTMCKGERMIIEVHNYIDECERKLATAKEDECNYVDRQNRLYYETCIAAAYKILGRLLTIQNE